MHCATCSALWGGMCEHSIERPTNLGVRSTGQQVCSVHFCLLRMDDDPLPPDGPGSVLPRRPQACKMAAAAGVCRLWCAGNHGQSNSTISAQGSTGDRGAGWRSRVSAYFSEANAWMAED